MKTEAILGALLIATPLVGAAADQPKLSCINDIKYNAKFLQEYPNAPAACREVIMRDGQKWARFEAMVVKVKGNNVTVDVKDAFSNTISTVTFAASPTAHVEVDGSQTKYSALQNGQTLTFWVPESVEGFYASPNATQATKFAVLERSDKLR